MTVKELLIDLSLDLVGLLATVYLLWRLTWIVFATP
jgi:hypothetical protein